MSSPYSSFFRRRTIGRAASPPTWACYEQIPYDDDDDDDDENDNDDDDDGSDSTSEQGSCSEDGEDYVQEAHRDDDSGSDTEHPVNTTTENNNDGGLDIDMEIDQDGADAAVVKKSVDFQKDLKGKQRAIIDPESDSPKKRHSRKRRNSVFTLRPILTIQRSQGFVWNQDLFVPPYIKDRYVASTSPPNSRGFISSASSANSTLTDYEVEVVEIRVTEGDLDGIIP